MRAKAAPQASGYENGSQNQTQNGRRSGASSSGPSAPRGGRLELWDRSRFRLVAVIREAARNQGRVELVEDKLKQRLVAVKAMPSSWVCESPQDFVAAHPQENELPWCDIAATYHLSCVVQLPCICEFVGVYNRRPASDADVDEICLALSYCAGGDLFSWLERSLSKNSTSSSREDPARLLLRHVFLAVHSVHAQGLAHGDLSLENVLLADADSTPEDARVKLIDFGASTGGRAIGTRGKPSYQAPEMHTGREYDARVADIFSLGVMVFALMVGDYPWQSTRPHVCAKFTYYSQKGMALYLGRRKVENSNGEIQPLSQVLSPEVIILLEGLLTVDPQKRLTLPAALQLPWFQQIPASSATRSGSSATSPPPDPAPGSSSEQPPVAAEADESTAPSGNAT